MQLICVPLQATNITPTEFQKAFHAVGTDIYIEMKKKGRNMRKKDVSCCISTSAFLSVTAHLPNHSDWSSSCIKISSQSQEVLEPRSFSSQAFAVVVKLSLRIRQCLKKSPMQT